MKLFDINKLSNILIFFYNHTNPDKLCKTKILKLLFLCDFKHIEKYGRPIIYDTYYHLPKGPIPSFTKNLLDNLKSSDDIDLGKELTKLKKHFKISKNTKLPQKYNQDVILPIDKNSKFDDLYFSESEIEVLNEICKTFFNATANDLIKITHKHKGYKMTNENQIIDYRFGLNTQDDIEYYNYWECEKEQLDSLI